MSFSLSQKAKADLRSIALFTEKNWGREQRNSYIKQFDDAFHKLADKPMLGKSCDDIKIGYKKFPQGSHTVFYKIGANSVIEIIRILHERMDIRAKLGTDTT